MVKNISTHTPLAGRDAISFEMCESDLISTHTPLAGRDVTGGDYTGSAERFLLTRPSRDVTLIG